MRLKWTRAFGLLALLCVLLSVSALAADDPDIRYVASEEAAEGTTIRLQAVNGINYLFLPSSADPDRLVLYFEGENATLSGNKAGVTIRSGSPVSLSTLSTTNAQGAWSLTLTQDGSRVTFRVMRSENLRSMYITSSDPAKDRAWVESAADKSNKAKNNGMVLLRADGGVVYNGTLKNMKGRGNSTWLYAKRPYQIKLKTETDLLETGDPLEAETTWVLLANYVDRSLLHNQITYDLALELGAPYSPHSAPVDLYYDGEYRGSYQLSEKTEVSDGRVNVHNMEADIEDLNPNVDDFDDLETVIGTLPNGCAYQYVTGLTMPADISGGYLLEIDYEPRTRSEASWFQTTHGIYVTVKSPEYLSAEGVRYISELFQHFEDAIYSIYTDGVDAATGKSFTEYVDLDSLVRTYLIMELAADNDAYFSSTFFYKPAGEDKLYAGPVWDFDTGYGSFTSSSLAVTPTKFIAAGNNYGILLSSLPTFRAKVQEVFLGAMEDLIGDILLSDSANVRGTYLHSMVYYEQQIAASQRMDDVLWAEAKNQNQIPVPPDLTEFLTSRTDWLDSQFSDASWGSYEKAPPVQPTDPVTRSMMATLLYRLAGSPTPATRASFLDVKDTATYADAISWAAGVGVLQGHGGAEAGRFGPDDPLTRAQAVTVLARVAKARLVEDETFTDIQHNSWYSGAVGWATQAGIIYGKGDNRFDPDAALTVEQLSLIMGRMTDYILTAGGR